jgi:hypothetical protein
MYLWPQNFLDIWLSIIFIMAPLLFSPDRLTMHNLSPSLLISRKYAHRAPLWFWLLAVGIFLVLCVNLLIKPALTVIFVDRL